MAKFVCSGCGRELTAGQAFCPDCGHSAKVVQEPSPPAQAANALPYQPNPVYYQRIGKTGKGMGWIAFMRTILWIMFAAIVISGLVLACNLGDHEPLMGVLCFFGSILMAFITVAGGMIALNNATNIRSIAINTSITVELLQKQENKK